MQTVNIHEAKTNLSRLIAMAVNGEPFVIAKAGKPLVTVSAIEHAGDLKPKRRWGFMEGQIKVSDDFNALHEDEIAAMFEGDAD